MATLAMPSTTCPAPPAVTIEVPDTWEHRLTAGSLVDVVFAADPMSGRLVLEAGETAETAQTPETDDEETDA